MLKTEVNGIVIVENEAQPAGIKGLTSSQLFTSFQQNAFAGITRRFPKEASGVLA
jgi:hypothetical protein